MEETENNEYERSHSPLKYKSKWPLLRNVIRAISLFKSHEVNEAKDVNELIHEINAIPTDKVYRLKRNRSRENSAYIVAIKDLRREQSLIQCVERGKPEDLDQIKLEIEQDPYKLLRNSTHPFSLINKRNREGQTPLYIACKNGNVEVVMLLLAEGADYLMTSIVDGEEETNLEVSVRWGHFKIVEELLKKKWSKNILEKAKKMCRSPEMIGLFKKGMTKKSKWFLCCCIKS
ncbi:hypothetical protein SteCoe_29102 [Stentor coeruleus]|uniref:Uncharacterized protein n=1 Tax=Stentor coeruleus TaxID=5963 RepID=A0A1R2B6P5_9CILI|nr:hypothetical protein SteCoe_29102 [Stentor coeruleus]